CNHWSSVCRPSGDSAPQKLSLSLSPRFHETVVAQAPVSTAVFGLPRFSQLVKSSPSELLHGG
ncbi:MAG: hypothetical protein ACPIOQ_02095, partial [Promethearchaeia archaeon]